MLSSIAPVALLAVALPMVRHEGASLPVSRCAPYGDALFPVGMARFEKRGVAEEVSTVRVPVPKEVGVCGFVEGLVQES